MSRKLILFVSLGLMIVLAAVITLLFFEPSLDRNSLPSTYSVHAVGCKALYLVLEELGLSVSRFRRKFTMLEAQSGVMVIIDPHTKEFSRREISNLKKWIEQGNRLVLFQGMGSRDSRQEKKTGDEKESPSVKARVIPVPSGYFGLRLRRVAGSDRVSVPVSIPDAPGVNSMSTSGETRWSEPRKDWVCLARDKHGPIVLARQMGSGSVIAISDRHLASNRYLSREDNLKLVLALILGTGKPAEIMFDEYHHGREQSDSIAGFVSSTVFLWVLVQALIGVGLFFYANRARHAGRFESLSEPRGRSSMEYIESMATIFARCKAGSVALEPLVHRFLAEVSRKTGLSIMNVAGQSLDQIPLRFPGGSEELSRLLGECREAVHSGYDAGRALALARRLGEARAGLERSRSRHEGFR